MYLGIDFGTSGARGVAIASAGNIVEEVRCRFEMSLETDLISCWRTALFRLLEQLRGESRGKITRIAINGTSSTVLLCDAVGNPVEAPLLYNDARGGGMREKLRNIAPPNHTVLSATSSLVKLLWMMQLPSVTKAKYFLHQADWLGFLLHGKLGISDYHNALKLGYDVEALQYPEWFNRLQISIQLPEVVIPGNPVGELRSDIAEKYNFPRDCVVCAGTTDSIAAFIASGANSVGEAVTSLGSTLVLKLLSSSRVDNSQYGIYSHRFGNLWLTGGASNSGGAVLKQFFSSEELDNFSQEIDLTKSSGLDYYPLLKPGERFPINDPNLSPNLEPRPDNNVEFLHGLLESMARIEARGYKLLQDFGADNLKRVYTAGGGAKNQVWSEIRKQYLGVSVVSSNNTEAAYGTVMVLLSPSIANKALP
ncbi:MAG: FGGY-family carbohydrate kinase [Cyanobacteria bacterium J06632_19]